MAAATAQCGHFYNDVIGYDPSRECGGNEATRFHQNGFRLGRSPGRSPRATGRSGIGHNETFTPQILTSGSGGRCAAGPVAVGESASLSDAAGTIGVGRVARAAPDGYTISIGHWGTHVVNGAIYELPYHVFNDFEPVSLIATNPQIIVARKAVPANTLQELIAWLKANAATATQGTAGHGSGSHVSGVYFQSMTGTNFSSCLTAAPAPRCRTLWPAKSTS